MGADARTLYTRRRETACCEPKHYSARALHVIVCGEEEICLPTVHVIYKFAGYGTQWQNSCITPPSLEGNLCFIGRDMCCRIFSGGAFAHVPSLDYFRFLSSGTCGIEHWNPNCLKVCGDHLSWLVKENVIYIYLPDTELQGRTVA